MNKKKLGDIIKFIIFVSLGIFFIYWFLLKLDPEQKQAIWESFISANYWWVGVAMICCLVGHFVRALRWKMLYRPMGYNPTIGNIFGGVLVTYLANLAFPRLGEVLRCAVLKTSEDIPVEKSLGTVVTERLIDTLLFLLVAAIGILLMYTTIQGWLTEGISEKLHNLPSISGILVAIALCILAGILIHRFCWSKLTKYTLFRKIDNFTRGCVEGVKSIFLLGTKEALLFFFYSLVIYFFYILGGLIIFQAFPGTHSLGFEAAFVLYLFGSVGMGLSQGGLGVYPVLVQSALAIYGIAMEEGTAAGWLLWGSQQVVVIVFGLIFFLYFSIKKKSTTSQIAQESASTTILDSPNL